MNFLNKLYVSPLCIFLVIFSIIFDIVNEMLIMFFICFIHELGHIVMALIFHCKINKVSINIFGFSAEIDNVEYLMLYKQIIVYIAGPLTVFVTYFLLKLMLNYNLINSYEYYKYSENNLGMCLFNLIPLYPLDGGRIIDALYRRICPMKECLMIKRIWTIVCSVILFYLLIKNQQIILFIILMSMVALYLFSSRYEYKDYLEKRMLINNCFSKKMSFNKDVYHFSNNLYLKNGRIVSEKEIIPILLLDEYGNKKYLDFR